MSAKIMAVTAFELSLPFYLFLVLGIILAGVIGWFLVGRQESRSVPPPPSVAGMGYGRDKWARQLALWQGILRRLESQAKQFDPIPERLQSDIADAQARVAEAQTALRLPPK